MTTRHFLGAHTIENGGIDQAARRAGAAKMTALQIFTAIPKFYGDKSSIKPERVARFRAALEAAGIAPRHVVAHAAYVLNTATHEEEKWPRASAGLTKELERSTALGIGAVCFHPGAAKDGDRAAAVAARRARDHRGARDGAGGDAAARREHRRRRGDDRAHAGGGRRDPRGRADGAPRAHRLRAGHAATSSRRGTTSRRPRRRSPRCSTRSSRRRGRSRASST